MNDKSTLKVYKSGEYEYIYIYYKLGKDVIRVNTKNKYKKSYMTEELFYNSKMLNYEELNYRTKILKRKVDNYIFNQLQYYKPTVSQKDCLLFIDGKLNVKQEEKAENTNKKLIEHYTEFYNFKCKELNYRQSVKDYLSLKNAILDYELEHKKKLRLEDINKEAFFVDFRAFLSCAHKRGLTKGGLNDNTINKRITSLKTFMKWIETNELFVFKKALYNFKTPGYENDVIALSKTDIQALKDLKNENTFRQKIIDIFICNCFLGLRYSDLKRLTKHHFVQDESDQYYIKMENKKTGITVEIPVLQTSMEIFTKYDFNLKLPCSQYFNREIKNILKDNKLFEETVIKKRKQLKINQEYPVLRRELITSHSCRRTFITLAIDANVPLNSLMLASGHTKIQTVKKYMKMNQNANAFKSIEL